MSTLSSKKRKEQSSTLHTFFSSAPTTAKKGKRNAKEITKESAPDIILIDDDPAPPRAARRKLSTASSDVEFVLDLLVEAKRDKKSSGPISRSEGRKPSTSSAKPSNSRPSAPNHGNLFGQPSSLLLPSTVCPPAQSDTVALPPRPSLFIPTSLLCPTGRASPLHTPFDACTSNHTMPVADAGPDIDLTIDSLDETWGTGDDEQVLRAANPSDIKIIENEPETDQIAVCPVCAVCVLGFDLTDVQDHINNCLDTPSAPPPHPFNPSTSTSPPKPPNKPPSNAFSVLMSSHKENEAWKEADAAEDPAFRPTKQNGGRRKAPFYKVLQGMPIAVDAFRYGAIPGVTAYFLTHAHSDHYTNLAANWSSGPIYCSEGTANLIIHMLSVDPKWVHPLPMDVPTLIPDTGGVAVTLIEANHCPGSCLFLYEGPQTTHAGDSAFKSPHIGSSKPFRYLHCGDFRASPRHAMHPAVKGKKIDHVYLDTTYLDPKYDFPPQRLVIDACAELARRVVAGEDVGTTQTMDGWVKSPEKQKQTDRILVVVGTYSVGKERILKAIAQALHTKIYCDARKAAILRCQPDAELHALLTPNALDACVHVLPLGFVTPEKLQAYLERFKGAFGRVVAFRPTGWSYTPPAGTAKSPTIGSLLARTLTPSVQRAFTHASLRPSRGSTPSLRVYGVPYSEHSSFFELTCFALSVEWGKMIATVNVGSPRSREKMDLWIGRWAGEKKRRGEVFVGYRELDYW